MTNNGVRNLLSYLRKRGGEMEARQVHFFKKYPLPTALGALEVLSDMCPSKYGAIRQELSSFSNHFRNRSYGF